jgi:hypothetical protein
MCYLLAKFLNVSNRDTINFSKYNIIYRKQQSVNLFITMMFMFISLGWDDVSELRPPTAPLFIPRCYMNTDNHGGMMLTRNNRITLRKPVPVPLCPPQILYGLSRARTQISVERGRRLIAWTMVRPVDYRDSLYENSFRRRVRRTVAFNSPWLFQSRSRKQVTSRCPSRRLDYSH